MEPAPPSDPSDLGLRDVARRIAAGDVSPLEVVEAVLARIRRLQPVLNAYISVFDGATAQARALERKSAGHAPAGPLSGVPISVKDLILTRDAPTTAGSRTFGRGIESRTDAPAVRRLRRAGAILIGKTNLHEIALGVTSENEHFGPVRNPWNPELIVGGSSGGSGAAVAAGMGYGSIGTDTRGSIRIPAACCGITGLKPTRGIVSTDGVIPLSRTLDHVGPMTRSVEDAAFLLGVMTGRRALLHRYLAAVDDPPERLTLGVCDHFFGDLDAEIEAAVREAIALLERRGYPVRSVTIPGIDGAQAASGVITLAEALAYHDERLQAAPEGFGPRIRERLERGYGLSALDLVRAEEQRAALVRGFAGVFDEVDCLVAPTVPAFPHRIGERAVVVGGREFGTVDSFTRLNSPQNMAGVPAVALPCGFSSGGLPIGMQLIGGVGRDEVVLAVGAAYQRETDWQRRRVAV